MDSASVEVALMGGGYEEVEDDMDVEISEEDRILIFGDADAIRYYAELTDDEED